MVEHLTTVVPIGKTITNRTRAYLATPGGRLAMGPVARANSFDHSLQLKPNSLAQAITSSYA